MPPTMSADDSVASNLSNGSGFSSNAESLNAATKSTGKPMKLQDLTEWLFISPSCCRVMFRQGDSDMMVVCGNEVNCGRKNHKSLQETVDGRAVSGYYRPTRNNRFVDGEMGTYKSEYEYNELEKARVEGNRRAVAELTGKAVYIVDEEVDAKLPAVDLSGGYRRKSSKEEKLLVETVQPDDDWDKVTAEMMASGIYPGAAGNRTTMASLATGNLKPATMGPGAGTGEIFTGGGTGGGGTGGSEAIATALLNGLGDLTASLAMMSTRLEKLEATTVGAAAKSTTAGSTTTGETDCLKCHGSHPPGQCADRKKTLHQLREAAPDARDGPWYAVARGRVPGVYRDYATSSVHVNGFPNAVHQKFPTWEAAHAFVQQHLAVTNAVEEALAKRDKEENAKTAAGQAALAGDAKTAARPATNSKASSKGDSAADTPDFRSAGESPGNTPTVPPPTPKLYGEDPSTGKPREVFGLQLGSEKEIREGLAPEGLAEEDVKDMAAAMTDGVALPGRSTRSETDATTSMDDFTAAVKDLSESARANRRNDIRPDTQWRSASRTSLRGISDEEQLRELWEAIQECRLSVEMNMYTGMGSILSKYCWSKDLEVYWAQGNMFTRISKDTVQNYLYLLDHLLTLVRDQGWDYAKVSLDYHAKKLSDIRTTSLNRLSALVNLYIYLRDARVRNFNAPKLQDKRNATLFERMAEIEKTMQWTHGPKCPKCRGSSRVHPPGKHNCPWKNSKDGEARKQAAIVEQAYKGTTGED